MRADAKRGKGALKTSGKTGRKRAGDVHENMVTSHPVALPFIGASIVECPRRKVSTTLEVATRRDRVTALPPMSSGVPTRRRQVTP